MTVQLQILKWYVRTPNPEPCQLAGLLIGPQECAWPWAPAPSTNKTTKVVSPVIDKTQHTRIQKLYPAKLNSLQQFGKNHPKAPKVTRDIKAK